MRVISFASLLEHAASDKQVKKIGGTVDSWDALLRDDVWKSFDESHEGAYAFLAFHPGIDQTIASYLRAGSLGSDSGSRILVLFTLDKKARWPLAPERAFPSAVKAVDDSHASYELVRAAIAKRPLSPFPGVLFFARVYTRSEPVFVSVNPSSSAGEVAVFMRQLFSIAEVALSKATPESTFASNLAAELAKKGYTYTRGEPSSMTERFYHFVRSIAKHGKDLATVAELGMKIAGAAAGAGK
jgi:hypothetical protein